MGGLKVKGLCDKNGRLYYRRKVRGKDVYIRLPDITDPTFAEEYERAKSPDRERASPNAGTLGALVEDYRASSDFRNIRSEKTRRNYIRYLDMIKKEDGHRTVKGVRPAFVRKLRDRYAETPGKANNWLNVFKTLMSYAAVNDWRPDNPTVDVKMLPIGEHEPWPADVLERAIAEASPMLRLLIITGLCSGARIGDVIRMQHGWHDGKIMEFRTSKNRANVAIPMHPLWIREIAKHERKSVYIHYDRAGKPFSSPKAVQERLRTLMASIGSPTYESNGKERGYSFHGLRKNASCYLAELGLSDVEGGSICGMTPETVRHYTKRARAYMIALGAASRVTKGDVLPIKGGRVLKGAK
ncbi:MAG: hypothetical protein DI547_04780 [Sphingobium sp.]|nr:MAG: hypothetical protein DI547_04780 [Sphingobium sp.]